MSAEAVYDFEAIIPRAVQTILADADLQAITIEDPPEFQKLRPRVEITFTTRGESQPKRFAVLPDGSKRACAFKGELKVFCITDADTQGRADHSKYRARVRAALAGIQDAVNGSELTLHKIQYIEAGQEKTGIHTESGYQITTFPFAVDVSIHANAWQLLDTP